MGWEDVAPLRVMTFPDVGEESVRCRQHLTPLAKPFAAPEWLNVRGSAP